MVNARLNNRLNLRVLSPKPIVSLISTIVSSKMGLLSERSRLDFGVALSTTVLIAVTIKSAYLPSSL